MISPLHLHFMQRPHKIIHRKILDIIMLAVINYNCVEAWHCVICKLDPFLGQFKSRNSYYIHAAMMTRLETETKPDLIYSSCLTFKRYDDCTVPVNFYPLYMLESLVRFW